MTRILLVFLLLGIIPASVLSQETIVKEITPITDSLYRYQYNMHVSVFLVRPEGILITDPTTVEAAEWLRDELKRRFNKPVRYMVYSHSHSDHIGGASVFDVPGVKIVAHELTKRALVDEPLPGARIPVPTMTFTEPMTLHFGGRTIRLFKVEPSTHARDLIAMYFVEDRTLFAVDVMSVKSVGFFDFSNENFPAMIRAIRNLQRIDYDHLVDSHGPLGTKADGDTYLAYLEDIESGVRRELARGATLEETQRDTHLNRYQHLALYAPWSPTNIEGAYVSLKGDPVKSATVTGSARTNTEPVPNVEPSVRIRALAVFCSACHGPQGISADAHFPNLAGQKYEYLLRALRAYQRQERYDPYMSQLEFLSDQDLQGIARFYSTLGATP
jgi:glyoxylase-like metal-dependent hydrolase (beta-lactamase superfamily II)/cytochrome c553